MSTLTNAPVNRVEAQPARPLVLRWLPLAWRERVYFWLYRRQHSRWLHLFDRAPLALCPWLAMYDLMPSDSISGPVAFNGCYEPELSRRLAAAARSGGTLVDVGANMGYFSLLWAGLHESNRVIAFEASPRNLALLRNNVQRNGLGERISIQVLAAGDRAEMVTFEPGPAEETGWGGVAHASSATSFSVPMVRIDVHLGDREIDVLKIDVEGADTWVLLGCEALLKQQKIGLIFFEQNRERMDRLGIAHDAARRLLAECGYDCVPTDRTQSEWMATPRGDAAAP